MYFYSYFPYIIFYLSPTYVSSYIILNINKKRTITGEQLIAMVCGSVSVSHHGPRFAESVVLLGVFLACSILFSTLPQDTPSSSQS